MVLSGVVRALGLVRARVWKWECMGGRARVETLGLVHLRVWWWDGRGLGREALGLLCVCVCV